MNKLVSILFGISIFLSGCVITNYEYYRIEPVSSIQPFSKLSIYIYIDGVKNLIKEKKFVEKIIIGNPYKCAIGIEGPFKKVTPISLFVKGTQVKFDSRNFHQRLLENGNTYYLLKDISLPVLDEINKDIPLKFEFQIEYLNGDIDIKTFEEKYRVVKKTNIGNRFINKQMGI